MSSLGVLPLSDKGLKVFWSAVARQWRMGLLRGPPSVQRSWGSGVCRVRLCDVTGLLWLGRPAVRSPIPESSSLDYCLCCPVPQNT